MHCAISHILLQKLQNILTSGIVKSNFSLWKFPPQCQSRIQPSFDPANQQTQYWLD